MVPPLSFDIGQRFGSWTVVSYAGAGNWICRCECGDMKSVGAHQLKAGRSLSCKPCRNRSTFTKHGKTGSRLQRIWSGAKTRCTNPLRKEYHRYGGRGISMCAEWEQSFSAFANWAEANGYADNLSLDRFPDPDGNYEPGNCRWATVLEQAANKSRRLPHQRIGAEA